MIASFVQEKTADALMAENPASDPSIAPLLLVLLLALIKNNSHRKRKR